jgi:hypothetical protein
MSAVGLLQRQSDNPTSKLEVGLSENRIPSLAISREQHAHYRAELARLDVLRHQGGEVDQTEILAESYRPCS